MWPVLKCPPTGALAVGSSPADGEYYEYADDYFHSEVGITGTTNILMPVIGLSVAKDQVKQADTPLSVRNISFPLH